MMLLAERYDALLIDLDGVLYRGDQAVPGAREVLEKVRHLGPKLVFLTNNSSRSPEQVAAKLEGMGLPVDPEEVLTSAVATAAMLEAEGAAGKTAYVIGEAGLRDALVAIGIRALEGEPDRADLVVVGWDRTVDYGKLRTAGLLVQRGARLIASNADTSYPAPDGLWPGAGAILAAVVATTGAVPTIVGKPSAPLFEAARTRTGARSPLVVGDRIDTDVAGAAKLGWDSLLVLTGASRPSELLQAAALPTYVAPDLALLLDDVPPARFRAARPQDVHALQRSLEGAGLGSEGVEERLDETVVSCLDRAVDGPCSVAATACVEAVDGYGILRSVAVARGLRSKGLGMLAVAAAVQQALGRGIGHLSLFTETAAPFFARLGFQEVPRDRLPRAVLQSDHASACPTAPAMVLDLAAGNVSPRRSAAAGG